MCDGTCTEVQPVVRRHSRRYQAAVSPRNPRWQALRRKAYAAARGRCAVCGLKIRGKWDTHHLSYEHLGSETLEDVQVVHRGLCHWIADRKRERSSR